MSMVMSIASGGGSVGILRDVAMILNSVALGFLSYVVWDIYFREKK